MSEINLNDIKLIYNVGLNDATYPVCPFVDGVQVWCKFYRTWSHMLTRCYSEKYQERQPTYIGCYVCKEWLIFSNFKKWMEKQDWKGKSLDKDLLVPDNKCYSPETCIFISRGLNNLLTDSAAKRGLYPLGVSQNKRTGKFISRLSVDAKRKNLGYFTTPLEAHRAWQLNKMQLIAKIANEQTDERLKHTLLLRCEWLQYALDNNLETKTFVRRS